MEGNPPPQAGQAMDSICCGRYASRFPKGLSCCSINTLGHFLNLGKDGNMKNNLTGLEFFISKHLSDATVQLLDLLKLQFVTFIYDDNCGKNIEFSNKEG